MKCSEFIYILQYFSNHKDQFIKLLNEEIDLFDNIIIKGLSTINIY